MNVSEKHYDEATEWLARLRASDVSDKDHEKFGFWLMQDSANKPAFDEMLHIWEVLGAVNYLEPSDFIESHIISAPVVPLADRPGSPLDRLFIPLAISSEA